MTGNRSSDRTAIRTDPFGTTPDGAEVSVHTFTNGRVTVAMLSWGATVQRIETPDRSGRPANISLGFTGPADYARLSPYFGATIGRFGNRIAGGRFTLDGKDYRIPVNEGANVLHGGPAGFDKRMWDTEAVRTADAVGVAFRYVSAAGEMGFPGELATTVTYTLNDLDELRIHYRATVAGEPTVLNLTNHVYLNLAGEGRGSVEDHVVELNASAYTPVDAELIPTGEIAPVDGTPFDFRRPTAIGARLRDDHPQLTRCRGYDHNLVLAGAGPDGFRQAADVWEPDSGRTVTVRTTEPGLQFYTGNFLDGSLRGAGGRSYRQGDAFCLETQHFPDSPNQPAFPSTVLRPGETFDSTTVFAFGTR